MTEFSNNSLIASLDDASIQINRYFTIFNVLFGTIGNVLNFLVLSQRSLRKNPCSWLFLVSSIANYVAIICGLITRLLDGWGADFTANNNVLCKLRGFILFNSRTIAMWLIMLAIIDRWFLSSTDANRRKKSTLKNAQRNMIVIVICSSLLYTQILYCYQAHATDAPLKCYDKVAWCRHLTDMSFAFITNLTPLIVMVLFGWMTIMNLRQNRNQLLQCVTTIEMNLDSTETSITTTTRPFQSLKKTDFQLLIMLFIQVAALALCSMPLIIHRLYSTFTANNIKSPLQKSIEHVSYNLVVQVSYLANGMPFYIYTLSGSIFRQELLNLMRTASRKIAYRRR